MIKNKNLLGYQSSISNFTASLSSIDSKYKNFTISKGAFSRARKKLPYEVLELINKDYVSKNKSKTTFKGLNLVAIDGTKLTMPDSTQLENIFKKPQNKLSRAYMPQATMVACLDLTSNLVSEVKLGSYDTSEKVLALSLLPNIQKESLVIADRYYGTSSFFYNCEKENLFYLSRLKTGKTAMKEVKEFIKTNKKTEIINIFLKDKNCEIKIRLIRSVLDKDGKRIVFATNLMNQRTFHNKELISLYKQRWEIETFFNRIKNIININKFHSRTYNEVMQEVYCSMIYANITSSLINITYKAKDILRFNKLSWKCAFNSVGRYLLDFLIFEYSNENSIYLKINSIINEISNSKSRERIGRFYPRYSKQPQPFWTKSSTRTAAKALFGLK